MAETRKVASAGRFGSRYGVGIRRKLLKVEPFQLQKHVCPSCGFQKVKRKGRGIFECRKCLHAFVGGAYLPQTLTGGIISKMVSQKMFSPEVIQQLSKGPEVGEAEQKDALADRAMERQGKKEAMRKWHNHGVAEGGGAEPGEAPENEGSEDSENTGEES